MKAAIFDMDGLMFDTEALYNIAWRTAAGKFGYELPDEKMACLRGANATVQIGYFNEWFGDTPFDEIKQGCRKWMVDYLSSHDIPIKRGLFELLDALKAKDYKIAVATGTTRSNAERWLNKAGVMPYLDGVVGGDEVKYSKPYPDIFLKAAQAMDVPIGECFVLEDSFNGIRAAAAAGATPVMVPDQDAPPKEIIDLCYRVLPSLNEMIELL